MPGFETLLMILLVAGSAVGAGILYVVLSQGGSSAARDALAAGDFESALDEAGAESRADLLAAAIAAKHLLRFDEAEARLRRLTEDDPGDGEAWLERGLVAAYDRRWDDATDALSEAASRRSDLLEPVTLHRAWIALERGDRATAKRLFEDVGAPIENKLRTDIGGGDPLFAEWFWQASRLWAAFGDSERAEWAWREGSAAAPESQLPRRLGPARSAP